MNPQNLILLDLFSGMGGFHLGLEEAGFNFSEVYFSEIDKHAIANYKYNFPNAKYIGGVESILTSGIRRPNIITFGSPCQDFSLAGKRKGMAGDRSSLIEYALSAISHFRPDLFIWENVKGTFSSNVGQDFWAIIQAFANLRGYRLEWQLVNTSWILPQNRERIYLVGHLTEYFRDWKGIFPISEREVICNQSCKNKEEIYETALTITAKGQSNWTGSFINVAGKINSSQDGVILLNNGISKSLTAGNYNVPKVLQRGHGYVEDSINNICPTIRGSSFEHNTSVIQVNQSTEGGGKQPYQHNRVYSDKGLCTALSTDAKSPIVHGVSEDDNIRRLTEIECERLQGFPDDWTKWGIYEKQVWINKKEQTYKIVEGKEQISKTQRYKMCGNAVTAKMVTNIGIRIKKNFK